MVQLPEFFTVKDLGCMHESDTVFAIVGSERLDKDTIDKGWSRFVDRGQPKTIQSSVDGIQKHVEVMLLCEFGITLYLHVLVLRGLIRVDVYSRN